MIYLSLLKNINIYFFCFLRMLQFRCEHQWLFDSAYRSSLQLQFNMKICSFHYLSFWHLTTIAAIFQICPCYQNWEHYRGKCVQPLTFPLLLYKGLLWKIPCYQSLTVLATMKRTTLCINCVNLTALRCQYFCISKTSWPETARMTEGEETSLHSFSFLILLV